MISHRHRCIYVKVPKCASDSLAEWMLGHARGRPTHHHAGYRGTLAERIPTVARALELWPGYRSFTFLRNPYRRFVSGYLHATRLAGPAVLGMRRRRAAAHPRGFGTLREYGELCAELLADTRHLWGPDALAYRRAHAERRYGPLGIRLQHLDFVSGHARPQVDFLPDCNPSRLFGVSRHRHSPLTYIGAVESLDADFERLREMLGMPSAPLPRSNVSSRHVETLENLRRDGPSRCLVETLYAQDFEFAGYPVGDLDGRAARLPVANAGWPGAAVAAGGLGERATFMLMSARIALEANHRRASSLRPVLAALARWRERRRIGS